MVAPLILHCAVVVGSRAAATLFPMSLVSNALKAAAKARGFAYGDLADKSGDAVACNDCQHISNRPEDNTPNMVMEVMRAGYMGGGCGRVEGGSAAGIVWFVKERVFFINPYSTEHKDSQM